MSSFVLTSEQQMLRDGLEKYLDIHYDLATSRAAVKAGAGWQPEIWRAMAQDLGLLGATLPEAKGGTGGGPIEMMIIAEALGRSLVVEPYVDTAVLGAGLLRRCARPRADDALARIVTGAALTAFAGAETAAGFDVVATTAERDDCGDGWVLEGAKSVVTTAPLATHLLVTARTPGSPAAALFLLGFDASDPPAGMTVHPLRTIDDRVAANLVLDGVRVAGDALIAGPDEAGRIVEAAVHEAIAAVCAEAVGCMRKVLADTVDYARQRKQFGQPISRFQVLQHRMVDMYLEVEQAAAATYLAVSSLHAPAPERARAVAAAKVTIARAARFVGQNAVQLHGGMGMTEELAVGHYFKRLTAIEYEFGAPSFHLGCYARLTDPRAGTARAGESGTRRNL